MDETERMPQDEVPVWELLVTLPDGVLQVVGPSSAQHPRSGGGCGS
jgi:hypothetical protein